MMNTDGNSNAVRAWKSARTMSLMTAAASIVSFGGWYLKLGVVQWQWQLASVLTFCCAAVTLWRRHSSLGTGTAVLIFLTSLGAALWANTFTNFDLARSGVRFEAFGGLKIAPLAVASIAPIPVWLGFFTIGACIVAPFSIYYLILSPEMQSAFSIQEPWYTSVYCVVALFVLRHRLRTLALERRMTRLATERRSLDKLARIFLGLRDLMNSPLQAIELTARLVVEKHLTPAQTAHYLERALCRLRELSRLLTTYEKDIDWSTTEASFDAISMLQEQLGRPSQSPSMRG